jgi:glycosyltransferase involved in cell wall biosynthesis
MGQALARVLTDTALADRMTAAARDTAADLHWDAVAQRYRDLALRLLADGYAGTGITAVAPRR